MRREVDFLVRGHVVPHPRRQRPVVNLRIERVNRANRIRRSNIKRQPRDRARDTGRQESGKLGLERLRGEQVFEQAIVLREQTKQRKIRIIAHGEDVGARMRGTRPCIRVRSRNLAREDGCAAVGITVREEIQSRVGTSSLRKPCVERLDKISASPKTTGLYPRKRLLDGLWRSRNWLRFIQRDVLVEQHEREAVRRLETQQRCLQRTVTSLQLVPLHGERVVEEKNDRARCRVRNRCRSWTKQSLREEEARLRRMSRGRGLGWRRKCGLWVAKGRDGEGV